MMEESAAFPHPNRQLDIRQHINSGVCSPANLFCCEIFISAVREAERTMSDLKDGSCPAGLMRRPSIRRACLVRAQRAFAVSNPDQAAQRHRRSLGGRMPFHFSIAFRFRLDSSEFNDGPSRCLPAAASGIRLSACGRGDLFWSASILDPVVFPGSGPCFEGELFRSLLGLDGLREDLGETGKQLWRRHPRRYLYSFSLSSGRAALRR